MSMYSSDDFEIHGNIFAYYITQTRKLDSYIVTLEVFKDDQPVEYKTKVVHKRQHVEAAYHELTGDIEEQRRTRTGVFQ